MQKRFINRFPVVLIVLLTAFSGRLEAQGAAANRTPEELKELFGYCDKPELVKRLKISADIADKIGEIDYWGLQQKLSVAANTNAAYATPNEVQEDMVKKYRGLHLSPDQVRDLVDYEKKKETSPEPCPVIVLHYSHIFDTLPQPRALLLYKTRYRKQLIDKLGINGRQADMLLETEVWKQRESLALSAIPDSDFSRIRKTVAMYEDRDKRLKAIGLTDDQAAAAILFFNENGLAPKQ